MDMNGNEVVITKNRKETGRFIPKDAVVSYLTDTLTGVLIGNYNFEEEREKGLKEKYKIAD